MNNIRKFYNFIKTHEVNKFLPDYFYIHFIFKGDTKSKILKFLDIREKELMRPFLEAFQGVK